MTAKKPFSGRLDLSILLVTFNERLSVDDPDAHPSVPQSVRLVIAQCMNDDPALRPNADEVLKVVLQAIHD
jgi:hypothetical protein